MNKSIINPIIALAALSFILTLDHYGSVKPPVNAPQLSTNTARVDKSLNASSQFDTLEANQAGSAALGLSTGIAVVGFLSLMKAKSSFTPKFNSLSLLFKTQFFKQRKDHLA